MSFIQNVKQRLIKNIPSIKFNYLQKKYRFKCFKKKKFTCSIHACDISHTTSVRKKLINSKHHSVPKVVLHIHNLKGTETFMQNAHVYHEREV